MVQHELIAEKKQCSGGGAIGKGFLATLAECAEECKDVSSMFIYGRQGMQQTGGCKSNGCWCYCETDASVDGTCDQKDNSWSNLYRIIQEGDILFI